MVAAPGVQRGEEDAAGHRGVQVQAGTNTLGPRSPVRRASIVSSRATRDAAPAARRAVGPRARNAGGNGAPARVGGPDSAGSRNRRGPVSPAPRAGWGRAGEAP